jgi:CheY-like chemotaxis protein
VLARILVVDDDQAILDIIELWLENEGHSIAKVLDGELALSALRSDDFDVMITDLIMPKTEGIQLIREIRQTHKDLGIIAISGGGRKGVNYLGAAEKLGANTVLSKPLQQNGIIDAVNALLP